MRIGPRDKRNWGGERHISCHEWDNVPGGFYTTSPNMATERRWKYMSLKMTGLPGPESLRDLHGKTAGDIFRERVGCYIGIGPRVNAEEDCRDDEADGLFKAWGNLLASINIDAVTETDGNYEQEDSEDEFFDASEG